MDCPNEIRNSKRFSSTPKKSPVIGYEMVLFEGQYDMMFGKHDVIAKTKHTFHFFRSHGTDGVLRVLLTSTEKTGRLPVLPGRRATY